METMQLTVPGATPAELRAGIEAAEIFLQRVGVTPADAAAAFFGEEIWDEQGFEGEDPRPVDAKRIARVWAQAQAIAIGTAAGDWRREPPCGSRLEPFAD